MTRCRYCHHLFFGFGRLVCPRCKRRRAEGDDAHETVATPIVMGLNPYQSVTIDYPSTSSPSPAIEPGGGSFGGAGASSTWEPSTTPDTSTSDFSGGGGGDGGGGGGSD